MFNLICNLYSVMNFFFLTVLDLDFRVSAVNLFYLGGLEGWNVILSPKMGSFLPDGCICSLWI